MKVKAEFPLGCSVNIASEPPPDLINGSFWLRSTGAGKLSARQLHRRRVISAHSCSPPAGGIPNSSSRRSLPLARFMGRGVGDGGRTSQMVFLRNYYVLIHSERAGWLLPPFPSYWEVTVERYEGEGMYEKHREGKEAWWLMWKVTIYKARRSECHGTGCVPPWKLAGDESPACGRGEQLLPTVVIRRVVSGCEDGAFVKSAVNEASVTFSCLFRLSSDFFSW